MRPLMLLLLVALAVSAMQGCGGDSMRALTFDVSPSSPTIQQGGSQAFTAVNVNEPGVNPPQQVDFDWSIQEATAAGASCTQLGVGELPPIPPACAAFGVIDEDIATAKLGAANVTYLAHNSAGTFHLLIKASLVTGTGPTGQQMATVTVQ